MSDERKNGKHGADPGDFRRTLAAAPGMAGVEMELATQVAGDDGYVNPDGNPVEAPAGTTFVELELEPAPGSCVRVEVALPPRERWCGRLV